MQMQNSDMPLDGAQMAGRFGVQLQKEMCSPLDKRGDCVSERFLFPLRRYRKSTGYSSNQSSDACLVNGEEMRVAAACLNSASTGHGQHSVTGSGTSEDCLVVPQEGY